MNRDMNILRGLLMAISDESSVEDQSHIQLAIEGGLLMGIEMGGGSRKHYPLPSLRLTPAGHDFVALARDSVIWERVRARIREKTGETSFAVLLALLEAEHKRVLTDGN